MKEHTISESGTQDPLNKLFNTTSLTSYKDIYIPAEALDLMSNFQGEIWRSNYRILVKIPSNEWICYGNGEMDLNTAHNFEQVSWIQISQYNAVDLASAFKQLTTFDEVSSSIKIWMKHRETYQQRFNYLKLLFQARVYLILERWVSEEIEKPFFQDYHTQLLLDTVIQDHKNSELPATLPTPEPDNDEDWESSELSE